MTEPIPSVRITRRCSSSCADSTSISSVISGYTSGCPDLITPGTPVAESASVGYLR